MHLRKFRKPLAFAAASLTAAMVLAALAPIAASAQGRVEEREWKESEAPPPPAFDVARLIPFEANRSSSLQFGVDPQTLSIGQDGVLRYVVVARSPTGAINAMYEGIRCTSGEYKTYARYNPGSGWNRVSEPQWELMRNSPNTRHTLQLARQGGCPQGGPPVRLDEVIFELKRQTYIRYDHN
jgi:hypothetical protein